VSKKNRNPSPEPIIAPAPEVSQAPKWILPTLIAVYCVLTLLLIWRVPFGLSPDEGAHFDYVAYVADNGSVPVFAKVKAPEYGYEFHQPPLYYALCAPLWKASGDPARKFLCRGVSLVCGALTLVLLWHAVSALFPHQKWLPSLATGFAALWPTHQGVGAAGSNDALAGLCCAGVLWAVAQGAKRGWQWRDSVLVGVFFGLGMLSKSTSLMIGVAGLGAAWMLASRRESNTEKAGPPPILAAASALGVTLVISGWWLVRNQTLYGDPLAAGAFSQTFAGSSPGPELFIVKGGLPVTDYLRALFLILFSTFWGVFGGPNTAIKMLNPFDPSRPAPEAQAVLPFMFICAVSTVVAVLGLMGRRKAESQTSPSSRLVLIWWSIGTALVVLALIRFNLTFFQAQARYLHPALLPISLAFALGWHQWLSGPKAAMRWGALTLFGVTLLFLTLWNVFVWQTLV